MNCEDRSGVLDICSSAAGCDMPVGGPPVIQAVGSAVQLKLFTAWVGHVKRSLQRLKVTSSYTHSFVPMKLKCQIGARLGRRAFTIQCVQFYQFQALRNNSLFWSESSRPPVFSATSLVLSLCSPVKLLANTYKRWPGGPVRQGLLTAQEG